MSQALIELLNKYRETARTEREKGTYFEHLSIAYLQNDPLQQVQYEEVQTYAEWAEEHGLNKRDVGIDLVASIRDGGVCAIQCKFYDENKIIQKGDIDSFFTASGKEPFTRRLIIDTTNSDWSDNAEDAMRDQQIETMRIGLSDMLASPIDWSEYANTQTVTLTKKTLRPHQQEALDAVEAGFAEGDRGKLLMACGTGKTFTSLKIAEHLAGRGKAVLYLVPSLALMSQTVTEWTADTETPLTSVAVCSDIQVGKRKASDDIADLEIHDLAFPATTDAKKLAEKLPLLPDAGSSLADDESMLVVFSTYQSIQVIADAQSKYSLREFDLIICDEAHRTTGAKFGDEDPSNFIKVHDQDIIKGKKRLYMTATPRIFGDGVKAKANEASVELCSMDDEAIYGDVFFQRGFGWAVENELLTDYKVIVLAVDEEMVSASVQQRLSDADSSLVLDDATKIIGCYKALTKADLRNDISFDPKPMHRALAFCKDIKTSKLIANEFPLVAAEYHESVEANKDANSISKLECDVDHVDGTFNATSRNRLLDWLREDMDDDECRILSNARCLSEGVDVPALDAILFLHPRKSQVDVVQAVGRVMRRANDKKMGYVILPVGIPAGVAPEDALNDNEKYKVIWQILNALRAHDERFDSTINKIEFGVDASHQIEVIPVTNQMPTKSVAETTGADIGGGSANDEREVTDAPTANTPVQTAFVFDEFAAAIMAKIVKKCGTREYWESWASDIAKIAETHITRIKTIVEKEGEERTKFLSFLDEIRDDLNPEISETDAIEMLAQHLITKPVFDTLFQDNEFTKNNPVSKAMEIVLDQLDQHNLGKEAESLQRFYASVQRRAAGIDNAQGRQALVVELYDKFFRTAFPAMTQKLGIVYTPVEVVDFIIHSVNDVLQSEFGQTLGSKGVHILDPFTGTGTFITRLLQSGLIKPEELEHKYKNEIHANEIVLLAYYIAAINIEAVYHDMAKQNANGESVPYSPFDGIVLTDTFQLYEQDKDMVANLLPDNSERRTAQKLRDIRVIIGNPPYSVGQRGDSDDAANIIYPNLNQSLKDTYVARATGNPRSLYDSYIKAFRWSSDRIKDHGIVSFVSNSGWIDKSAADGLRSCLAEEFSNLFVINLRGDIRKNMLSQGKAGEGGNIFGSGSMTGVSICIFVKNPSSGKTGNISYFDIGDDLSTDEKLRRIVELRSVAGLSEVNAWHEIEPDADNDWIGQGDRTFQKFPTMGNKRGSEAIELFKTYSSGLKTNRDAWCYNFSQTKMSARMEKSVGFYNRSIDDGTASVPINDAEIRWSWLLRERFTKGIKAEFSKDKEVLSNYRPFIKSWLYYDTIMNENRYLLPRQFPSGTEANLTITVSGVGARAGFTAFLVGSIPCLDMVEKGQCFPLNLYELTSTDNSLFATGKEGYTKRDGISDAGLKHFQVAYPSETITKEDLFYYIYGLLHSPDYRERFKNNLSKELPRIPAVKKAEDFWAFSKAGRELGDLHVNYEAVEPYPIVIAEGDLRLADIADPKAYFRVEKMKFGGKGRDKDKSIVHYNPRITMTQIPLEAYDYVVNGKPALEWVMERQCVKTDKASGIVNDANDYANETVSNPAYPLELFQRVITVSLETMKIVRGLPALDID